MSKRFFDTDLWINKPWFIELTPGEKAAWYYLLSTCDNVTVTVPVPVPVTVPVTRVDPHP